MKSIIDLELADNVELKSRIEEILVPVEKVFEVKDGKKKSKTKNFFPGYILVNSELDNQVKLEEFLKMKKLKEQIQFLDMAIM